MANKNVTNLLAIRIDKNEGPYVPATVDADNLHIWDRGLAWKLASSSNDDPVWEQIHNCMSEYNTLVDVLRNTQGFFERFAENGFCISIDEISEYYGDAHRVNELKCYKFSTELVYQNGFLFDASYAPKYRLSLPELGDITFCVGATDSGYPEKAGKGKKLLWNWYDDERDFTFALWSLFDELGYLPGDDIEKNYDGYLSYDQHRLVMEKPDPNLMKCLQLLISMGYLTQYTIVPEQPSPWFSYRASKDGTIGLAVLDQSFRKDTLLVEKIRLILSSSENDLSQKKYFLTNSDGRQELSQALGTFGGHQKYMIYGEMDCTSANRHIANGKYIRGRVFFADEKTAIAAGYRPCAICMRSEYKKWKEK
jgi:hypothetical protein